MSTTFAEDGGWDDENAGDKGANPDFSQPEPFVVPERSKGIDGINDSGTDYLDDDGAPASGLTADGYSAELPITDLSALDENTLESYDETASDRAFDNIEKSDNDPATGYSGSSGEYATAGDVGIADTYEPVGDPNFEEDTRDEPQSFKESSESSNDVNAGNHNGGFMDKAKEKLNDLMGNSDESRKK